jgi:hypothetical protein
MKRSITREFLQRQTRFFSNRGRRKLNTSLAIAGISAITAIAAAFISSRSAHTSKRAEISAQQLRDLENRISEKKYDVYRPMILLLQRVIDREQIPPEEFRKRVSDFSTWIIIYGSDEAVRAFHNFMQVAYNDPPVQVLMRFYAEFVITARKDMGSPQTDVSRSHFLGMRISDLYTSDTLADLDHPIEELTRETHWMLPWQRNASRTNSRPAS